MPPDIMMRHDSCETTNSSQESWHDEGYLWHVRHDHLGGGAWVLELGPRTFDGPCSF